MHHCIIGNLQTTGSTHVSINDIDIEVCKLSCSTQLLSVRGNTEYSQPSGTSTSPGQPTAPPNDRNLLQPPIPAF
jgi:hypothetical protein